MVKSLFIFFFFNFLYFTITKKKNLPKSHYYPNPKPRQKQTSPFFPLLLKILQTPFATPKQILSNLNHHRFSKSTPEEVEPPGYSLVVASTQRAFVEPEVPSSRFYVSRWNNLHVYRQQNQIIRDSSAVAFHNRNNNNNNIINIFKRDVVV